MSTRTLGLSDRLYAYLTGNSLRETELLRRLRLETAQLPAGGMQIAPEQGQFMALLVELTAARKVLEIGTFTGYSALVMALALPPDGCLLACDTSAEWTEVARRYWREAGVMERIHLRLAPARKTLAQLLDEGQGESFDLVFIDADKESYGHYYEQGLALLRQGGLIVADNVLWDGLVADPEVRDEDTEAIRAFNRRVHADERVSMSLVPIGDGLTLARKR